MTMKLLTFTACATLLALSGQVLAAENTSTIEQIGANSTVTVEQTGDGTNNDFTVKHSVDT